MGMDVYGINPKQNTAPPEIVKKLEGGDWTDKFMKLSEDEKSQYFDLKSKWEDENPGVYFRNNVWWWRPLWDYVWKLCGDDDCVETFDFAADRVITREQYEEGHHNSGAEISVHQAELIALRLEHAIKMGWTKKYRKQYETDTKDDEYQYPFHEDNVKAFAEFCKDSGGFSIQ